MLGPPYKSFLCPNKHKCDTNNVNCQCIIKWPFWLLASWSFTRKGQLSFYVLYNLFFNLFLESRKLLSYVSKQKVRIFFAVMVILVSKTVDSECVFSLCRRNFGAFSLAGGLWGHWGCHSKFAKLAARCYTALRLALVLLGLESTTFKNRPRLVVSSDGLEKEGKGLSWLSLSLRPRQAPALLTFQPGLQGRRLLTSCSS